MSEKAKALKKDEKIVGAVDGGYLFVKLTDGVVRFRSDAEHEEHIESLKFVEPAKPTQNIGR